MVQKVFTNKGTFKLVMQPVEVGEENSKHFLGLVLSFCRNARDMLKSKVFSFSLGNKARQWPLVINICIPISPMDSSKELVFQCLI